MAAQDGFTLVELLIAALLMGLLLTASLAVLTGIERGQREVGSRTDELARARAGVERMTREIRQARSVTAYTGAGVTLNTVVYTNGAANAPTWASVSYACSGTTCTRAVGGGTATTIVPNVTNPSSVFSFTTNAANKVSYIAFDITMRTQGANRGSTGTISLADGVGLRNVT